MTKVSAGRGHRSQWQSFTSVRGDTDVSRKVVRHDKDTREDTVVSRRGTQMSGDSYVSKRGTQASQEKGARQQKMKKRDFLT